MGFERRTSRYSADGSPVSARRRRSPARATTTRIPPAAKSAARAPARAATSAVAPAPAVIATRGSPRERRRRARARRRARNGHQRVPGHIRDAVADSEDDERRDRNGQQRLDADREEGCAPERDSQPASAARGGAGRRGSPRRSRRGRRRPDGCRQPADTGVSDVEELERDDHDQNGRAAPRPRFLTANSPVVRRSSGLARIAAIPRAVTSDPSLAKGRTATVAVLGRPAVGECGDGEAGRRREEHCARACEREQNGGEHRAECLHDRLDDARCDAGSGQLARAADDERDERATDGVRSRRCRRQSGRKRQQGQARLTGRFERESRDREEDAAGVDGEQ